MRCLSLEFMSLKDRKAKFYTDFYECYESSSMHPQIIDIHFCSCTHLKFWWFFLSCLYQSYLVSNKKLD